MWLRDAIAAPQSKNAVCANIKRSRYFHQTLNFWSFHSILKGCMYNMFYIKDTPLSYGKTLIFCKFLQEFSSGKESTLRLI